MQFYYFTIFINNRLKIISASAGSPDEQEKPWKSIYLSFPQGVSCIPDIIPLCCAARVKKNYIWCVSEVVVSEQTTFEAPGSAT